MIVGWYGEALSRLRFFRLARSIEPCREDVRIASDASDYASIERNRRDANRFVRVRVAGGGAGSREEWDRKEMERERYGCGSHESVSFGLRSRHRSIRRETRLRDYAEAVRRTYASG